MCEREHVFPTLEDARKKAMKSLEGEQINAIEIHWGHGTLTIQQATTKDPEQPYNGWEIIEDV